jgi:Arc/MetJ-type ribon-helix-helix transcriptional regulator
MARNPKAEFRMHAMLHAYLDDLVNDGTYGGTKSEVLRRFVEEGIRAALNAGRIAKRDIRDFGGPAPSED